MECRACGRDLSGAEHRMVAEWPFCLDCFERLLKRPEPTPTDRAPAHARVSPSPAPQTGPLCIVCGRDVAGRDHVSLGPLVVCAECVEGLGTPSTEEETDEAQVRDEPREKVAAEPRRYVNCTACGRRIPEGGSKSSGDQRYCPDCYRALPVPEDASGASEEPRDDGSAGLSAEATQQCECCQRSLHPGAYAVQEGFVLCQACLSTDHGAAIDIARARHLKRMLALKEDLGGSRTPGND